MVTNEKTQTRFSHSGRALGAPHRDAASSLTRHSKRAHSLTCAQGRPYAPPGIAHWQGSTPSTAGTQFNIHRGAITWLNDVTDAEYNGPVAPRK